MVGGRQFRIQQGGWLSKLLAVGLLALVLTFSLVIFAFVVVGGLLAWGYLLWKTRKVRRQMREAMQEQMRHPGRSQDEAGGLIIEGEVVREDTGRPSAVSSRPDR